MGFLQRLAAAFRPDKPAAAAAAGPSLASTTQATLLDRIQIEDLIVRYYYELGAGGTTVFGKYFTEDAVFDVSGKVARGRDEIDRLYTELGGGGPVALGTFHMLLSNPLIEVQGDTATARFIWTGVLNDTHKAPPRLAEQGREYDLLVRQDGEWRIKKRVVIADSGVPGLFDATYSPRKDYDILRDD